MPCPICDSKRLQPYLKLNNSPVYQHPIQADEIIPLPHHIDIYFQWCERCGHCFQADYNEQLLTALYTCHYYTPTPDGVGHTFRDDFFNSIKPIISDLSAQTKPRILEIGSSTGELLKEFQRQIPHCQILGFEPNEAAATEALKNGIATEKEFFDENVGKNLEKFDLIVSRHVIEHIADFRSFFAGVDSCSSSDTVLILETPSLDFAHSNRRITPFHIEHLHVFSAHSLSTLSQRYGWKARSQSLSPSGNLVMHFYRQSNVLQLSCPVYNTAIQSLVTNFKVRLQQETAGKKVILWGGGAGGLAIITLGELYASHIVDGNINKKGKHFCSMTQTIEFGPELIESIVDKGQQDSYALVIGSTFFTEIRQTLSLLGWQGEIISPYEWKL
jgi:2-polyprenyl-3-methyl-5-hydroxy-6-metoxy-1,4-benzoquinol methylase